MGMWDDKTYIYNSVLQNRSRMRINRRLRSPVSVSVSALVVVLEMPCIALLIVTQFRMVVPFVQVL